MPLICVPITVSEPDQALADAHAARLAGADMVELRVDGYFTGGDAAQTAEILRLVAESPLPCIVTCRGAEEGGQYDGDDDERVSLYERLGTAVAAPGVEHPPAYIDAELALYTRSENIRRKINLAVRHPEQLREVGSSLILSVHDFTGRPRDLIRKIALARSFESARVIKIAYTARSVRDNLELFDLLAEADRPTIALGMGPMGLMSRVLAGKFGGFLTFASLRRGGETAPGQPTVGDLLGLYRFRAIRPTTRVHGLIGWPVEQSLSPMVHNAGFEVRDEDRVYVPLPVPEGYEHFKATLAEFIHHPRLDFSGCSVTIPHKRNLYRFAVEQAGGVGGPVAGTWAIDPVADLAGAANTLAIQHEGARGGRDGIGGSTFAVLNTDGPAALECLVEALQGRPVEAWRIALIGAGGVARSIAASLALAGATVVVYNRTRGAADELADGLMARGTRGKVVAADLATVDRCCCHAVVNCTPVGMRAGPEPTAAPVDLSVIKECDGPMVVMDTVYNPLRTPLLARAEELGRPTIDGVSMFVRQAALQFRAWTGQPAPIELFDRLCREALGEVKPRG